MKKRTIGMAMAALLAGAAVAGAQERIGVMDGQEVFKEFHKTKAAMDSLRKLDEELRDAQRRMIQELEQMDEAVKKAIEESEDKALSETVRARKRTVAEEKLTEMKEFELKVRRSDLDNRRKIEEQQGLMFRPIIQEIRQAAAALAREKGLALVLDSSETGLGPVVFAESRLDLTDEVMKKLNPKPSETPK